MSCPAAPSEDQLFHNRHIERGEEDNDYCLICHPTLDLIPTQNKVPATVAATTEANLVSNIPAELRVYKNFLCWILTPGENGSLQKHPFNPTTVALASCNDPTTWTDFETAHAAVESRIYESIGIALTKELGFAIVDFDKVRDSADDPFPKWVLDEVAKLDSYTEISASGRGLHVLVWSDETLDNINRQQQHAEIHFRNKMFALSGNVFEGRTTIQRRSLADLHKRISEGNLYVHKAGIFIPVGTQRFRDICADDWAKHGLDSRSAAVQSALVSLAYQHDCDAERMRTEFEDTKLCDAWEKNGKWTRLGEREITKAIEFAKANAPKPDGSLTSDQLASLLVGEPRAFNPREYALKPLSAPGQKFSGWFPRGRFALVSGASGAMKTTFVAQALVSGRDGKPFLNHEPGGMSFCFVFADRGEYDAEETFERMGFVGQVPFRCINELDRAGALNAIAEVAQKYDVLFIDGGDLLVEDNNDGTHVRVFASAVQRIARHYGVAMIVSTGANKQSDKAIKEGAQRRSITKGSEVWGRTGGTVFSLN